MSRIEAEVNRSGELLTVIFEQGIVSMGDHRWAELKPPLASILEVCMVDPGVAIPWTDVSKKSSIN